MATLRLKLRNKIVSEVDLQEDQTYTVGRKEDCDIVLLPEKGISREHFKLTFVNGAWQVDVVSRYGEVIYGDSQVQIITLSSGAVFKVPPYEFLFIATVNEDIESLKTPGATNAHLPALTGVHEPNDFETPVEEQSAIEEKTVIGAAPMSAYIKISDGREGIKEMILLDVGESWIAGRDATCHIQIRDQRVSRRQFEIRRAGNQHFILDLGSVNGTLLNGNPLSTSEMTPLKSGDAISVLKNYLYFELHDASFKSRLENVNLPALNLLAANSESLPEQYQYQPQDMVPYQGGMPPAHQQNYPAPYSSVDYREANNFSKGKFDFQKNRPKIIIGVVVLLGLVYFLKGNDEVPIKATPTSAVPSGPSQDIFNKLKPEQQALLRQRYKDAKNLYMQGKYQLAQDEISKIQEVVPDYEDTKEIERLSKEAIFIQDQQRRQDQIEKAKIEIEEKINTQTAICQKKLSPQITMGEMEDCLSSVLQFNPDHPKIIQLKAQVESYKAAREAQEVQRAAYKGQVAKLASLNNKAQKLLSENKLLDAIDAFEIVAASSLPDPNGYKGLAKKNIVSIRKSMGQKTAGLQSEAEKFYQAQNLREAIIALKKARAIDPTNLDIPVKIDHYTSELRKQMMNLYQEGILEESFGNVDGGEAKSGAKDKWKKILSMDIPEGEFYKKAYLKLKKYGAL